MSTILDTLITDRTADDVINNTSKGQYNTADLNRVGAAVAYVAGLLEGRGYTVSVTARTNWTDEARRTPSALGAYLADITTLRAALSAATDPPVEMEGLTVDEANNIEKILVDCGDSLGRMAQSLWYCNEIGCGEV